MPRMTRKTQRDLIELMPKKMLTVKENGQKKKIDQDINVEVTQAGTREDAPRPLAVEAETARITPVVMLLTQMMKHQMVLRGSSLRSDDYLFLLYFN